MSRPDRILTRSAPAASASATAAPLTRWHVTHAQVHAVHSAGANALTGSGAARNTYEQRYFKPLVWRRLWRLAAEGSACEWDCGPHALCVCGLCVVKPKDAVSDTKCTSSSASTSAAATALTPAQIAESLELRAAEFVGQWFDAESSAASFIVGWLQKRLTSPTSPPNPCAVCSTFPNLLRTLMWRAAALFTLIALYPVLCFLYVRISNVLAALF